jgi:hypothetical protein
VRMTEQLPLLGPADYVAQVRGVCIEIYNAIGAAEAVLACGCARATLDEALTGSGAKNSRFIRIEWVRALMDKAPNHLAMKLKKALAGEGFSVIPTPLPPDVELANLKEIVLRKFGPAGAEAIEEARS